jgi:3-carboxy-cis,cis-muconate cycloisomerase
MTASIFDAFLTPPAIAEVFGERAVVAHMLDFEAALARAQAEEGVIPAGAADAIAASCDVALYDPAALVSGASRAGSLAIPLITALRAQVARHDADAAQHVHHASTSQDAIDTAAVLATRRALALIDAELAALSEALLGLAQAHAATPVLARTLMQPAGVASFGLKCIRWTAPVVRARQRMREAAVRALVLQLGGPTGLYGADDARAVAVGRRMATALKLGVAPMPWHTQRDEWVRLGSEVAVVAGSLSKIATDLSLMAQGEVGELAEPAVGPDGRRRGGSSALAHKRNPVSAMVAIAACRLVPARAASVLASMAQEHERGLGTWHAELAEWPGLFTGLYAAAQALREAFEGLEVDARRMHRHIDEAFGARIDVDGDVRRAASLVGHDALALRDAIEHLAPPPWSTD